MVAMSEFLAERRRIKEKHGITLEVNYNPGTGVLGLQVVHPDKTRETLAVLKGGTTTILFNKLNEEMPVIKSRYGWE